MDSKKIKYRWSDAWLLLAIEIAARKGPAELSEIVGAGDMVNRTIFGDEEFESGLYRLTKGGWIKEDQGRFTTTDQFKKINIHHGWSVDKCQQLIEKSLGAEPWRPKEPCPHPDNQFRYPGFSSEIFSQAIKKYKREFWKKYKELDKSTHTHTRSR